MKPFFLDHRKWQMKSLWVCLFSLNWSFLKLPIKNKRDTRKSNQTAWKANKWKQKSPPPACLSLSAVPVQLCQYKSCWKFLEGFLQKFSAYAMKQFFLLNHHFLPISGQHSLDTYHPLPFPCLVCHPSSHAHRSLCPFLGGRGEQKLPSAKISTVKSSEHNDHHDHGIRGWQLSHQHLVMIERKKKRF